jgi:hypothetical protein
MRSPRVSVKLAPSNSGRFADLAEKLKMDVTDLMRQCNGKRLAVQSPGQGVSQRNWVLMSLSSTVSLMRLGRTSGRLGLLAITHRLTTDIPYS